MGSVGRFAVVLVAVAACSPFDRAEGEGEPRPDASRPEAGADAGPDGQVPPPASGPLALWDFGEGQGTVVRDRIEPALDLTIEDPSAVGWATGFLGVKQRTRIASAGAATKIHDAIRASNALSIEAWIRPANTEQDGPARIVSAGRGTGERNFMLGQSGSGAGARYVIRLRAQGTNGTGNGGELDAPGGSARTELTHVVFTRTAGGLRTLWLDGTKALEDETVPGALATWDTSDRLTSANEDGIDDRPWLGELHLAAIYAYALAPEEVSKLFAAGPERTSP